MPELLLRPFGQASAHDSSTSRASVATLGVARDHGLHRERGRSCARWPTPPGRRARPQGARARGSRAPACTATPRPSRTCPAGRTAVLTFNVSSQGVDGVVLVQAPLRDVQEQVSRGRAPARVRRRARLRRRAARRCARRGAARAPPRAAAGRRRPHRARLVRGADRRPQAATRSASWRARWTRCACASTRWSARAARSSRMPRTSCARRSRRWAATSSCSPRAA